MAWSPAGNIRGPNGSSVEMRKTATHVQWRVMGAPTWIYLISLDDLVGPAGPIVPGGAVGAWLAKLSATDGDAAWTKDLPADATIASRLVGSKGIAFAVKTGAYTFGLDDRDAGCIKRATGNQTWTLPGNVFESGDIIPVANHATSGNVTIATSGGMTLRQRGTGTTGNRVFPPHADGAIIIDTPTIAYIGGMGMT